MLDRRTFINYLHRVAIYLFLMLGHLRYFILWTAWHVFNTRNFIIYKVLHFLIIFKLFCCRYERLWCVVRWAECYEYIWMWFSLKIWWSLRLFLIIIYSHLALIVFKFFDTVIHIYEVWIIDNWNKSLLTRLTLIFSTIFFIGLAVFLIFLLAPVEEAIYFYTGYIRSDYFGSPGSWTKEEIRNYFDPYSFDNLRKNHEIDLYSAQKFLDEPANAVDDETLEAIYNKEMIKLAKQQREQSILMFFLYVFWYFWLVYTIMNDNKNDGNDKNNK